MIIQMGMISKLIFQSFLRHLTKLQEIYATTISLQLMSTDPIYVEVHEIISYMRRVQAEFLGPFSMANY